MDLNDSSVSEALCSTVKNTSTDVGPNGKDGSQAAMQSTQRLPPTKATTSSLATTTLANSFEQQTALATTIKGSSTLMTPLTPRIELSRASSSSHQEEDSRESSPENVFDQVGTGTLQDTIEHGFREEGALDLRSSTEELYFMDPEQKKEEQKKVLQQQQNIQSSPHILKFEDHQKYLQQHQRKDSASSEVAALLCISGRSSRISSVGSQCSAASRLSAVSGVSRSPSPHRIVLETSFCGPKPLQNVIDGRIDVTTEAPTAELLEHILLSRKHDPTQAVLAEGIQVESSPKKQPSSVSNGGLPLIDKKATQNRSNNASKPSVAIESERRSTKSPGQMVVGKTPSGTEYIRINLKPDHMYEDKGIAPHERVVEAPNTLQPAYARGQKKPGTLSISTRPVVSDKNLIPPTASPKLPRHGAATLKNATASRSPSPVNFSVSRKSSFSSIFRMGGKESPDSPRERSRPRSKSKDRQNSQSQNVTPNKQKSVLAIFSNSKRGSSAGTETNTQKTSSPVDGHDIQLRQQQKSRQTPTPLSGGSDSRPPSRLRYYDDPVEGYIHIPLHTPPEEKEARRLLESIQKLNEEPRPIVATAITPGQLAAAAAALKPVGARPSSHAIAIPDVPPPPPPPRPLNVDRKQHTENVDAINSLPQDNETNNDRSCSFEVNQHSSQESGETVGSEVSCTSAVRISMRSKLANVEENISQESGTNCEIHRLPSVDSTTSVSEPKVIETVATINTCSFLVQQKDLATAAKEKRKLLFATRVGSGSQEQIFSTQFSISKTESQSSQLSENVQPIEKTILEENENPTLQVESTNKTLSELKGGSANKSKISVKQLNSAEIAKSGSTSEGEKSIIKTTTASVELRRNKSNNDIRCETHSNSDENATLRHSRYLDNFDALREFNDNSSSKSNYQSTQEKIDSSKNIFDSEEARSFENKLQQQTDQRRKPTLPQPPPPSSAPSPSFTGSRSPTPPKSVHHSESQSSLERARQTPTKPPRTTTPTRRTPIIATPASVATVGTNRPLRKHLHSDRHSIHSTDEPVESSESERDSDLAACNTEETRRLHLPRHVGAIEDNESTGLVSQESFDDELPYIPTTLPEERAHGIALIPMKERANMELKTCPVERPRSTTPMNPTHLEEYCGIVTPQEVASKLSLSAPVRGEKLRISLPKKDPQREKIPPSTKSPRRSSNATGKSWFEFAEEGLRAASGNPERKDSNKHLLKQQNQTKEQSARTINMKSEPNNSGINSAVQSARTGTNATGSTQRKLSGHWIDFENIPEKRKPPKRITTLPKESILSSSSRGHHVHRQPNQHQSQMLHEPHPATISIDQADNTKINYNYVNPEDCQCECHETERESSSNATPSATTSASKVGTGIDLLQQGEDLLPLIEPDSQEGIEPSDSSREYSYYTDDEAEVHVRQSSSKSNRSNPDEFPRRDVSPKPKGKKFPDYRK